MRILHTADWHLGKTLHQHSLLESQQSVLGSIVSLAEEHSIDALILAGDVFDRALAPASALEVFDSTIAKLVGDLGIPCIVIGGNHDSGVRLDVHSGLVQHQGLFLRGLADHRCIVPITLKDKEGVSVDFFAFPFCHPLEYAEKFEAPQVRTHQDVFEDYIGRIKDVRRDCPVVVTAHCFVAGASIDDSEVPISLGGADLVNPNVFEEINYVALGHVHRRMVYNGGRVAYSGSPMRYSLSEATDSKSATLVDIDHQGRVKTLELPLHAEPNLSVALGYLGADNEILFESDTPRPSDFVFFELTNTVPVVDAARIIREKFPRFMGLRWRAIEPDISGFGTQSERLHHGMSVSELANLFLSSILQRAPIPEEVKIVAEAVLSAESQGEAT